MLDLESDLSSTLVPGIIRGVLTSVLNVMSRLPSENKSQVEPKSQTEVVVERISSASSMIISGDQRRKMHPFRKGRVSLGTFRPLMNLRPRAASQRLMI